MQTPKYQFINSLTLKIIAIVSMTFDHIGVLMQRHVPGLTADIFRILGRFAMPLIAICFAEAMRYTKDKQHYMARIGLMAMIAFITEIIMQYTVGNTLGGNIFLTLLCSAAFIYFYEKEDNKRFLFLVPLAIIFLSTASEIYANFNNNQYLVFYPPYLIAQYSLYGFLLCIGCYYAYQITDHRVKAITNENRTLEELRQYPYYRSFTNILWCGLIVFLTLFIFLLTLINPKLDIYSISRQSYALLAIIPIVFYNGKKGYNSKAIQYSFYFYYPLHILIIFISFYLVFGTV